jgi:elongation factor Ts
VTQFTAKDVQRLRQTTGAGMMDAKRALQENGGDFETAARWLREKGLAASAKRADRANEQGAVSVAVEEGAGAIVELRCETDYVAKSGEFRALVDELARAVAVDGDAAAAARAEAIDDLKVTLKENIDVGRMVRFESGDGAVLDSYLHVQNDRGVIAVLVEVAGGDRRLAHDVALHIASMRPEWVTRDDVPPERVAQEREELEARTRNEGKPEAAIPKIVEGRLNGFYKDVGGVLLDQPFVREPKQTVSQVLGGATVTRFARVEVGR